MIRDSFTRITYGLFPHPAGLHQEGEDRNRDRPQAEGRGPVFPPKSDARQGIPYSRHLHLYVRPLQLDPSFHGQHGQHGSGWIVLIMVI